MAPDEPENMKHQPPYQSLNKCCACPRLVAHRDLVAREYPNYFNRPVPAWGRQNARILIVGLAPGLHGAANTGRPFVGDASGDLLFAALHEAGLASHPKADRARLSNVKITNAVKCLPPQNAPKGDEVGRCSTYLQGELSLLLNPNGRKGRVVLCLGGVAFRATLKALGYVGSNKLGPFHHGAEYRLEHDHHSLIASFHPSRLNANTGRIDVPMLVKVLKRAKLLAG